MDVSAGTSLAIAQAAKETGWGTSRFALEGNALFGQWTFSGEGLKPLLIDNDNNETHKVMKFQGFKSFNKSISKKLKYTFRVIKNLEN